VGQESDFFFALLFFLLCCLCRTHVMASRTIIVGDVHGCMAELQELLAACDFQQGVDELVFVGDLIGKGPQQREVVRFVQALAGVRVVMGNWDHIVVRWLDAQARPPGSEAVHINADILRLVEQLEPSELEWFRTLPLYLRLPHRNVIVVHAGIIPNLPLEQQTARDLMHMRGVIATASAHSSEVVYEATEEFGKGQPWTELWAGPEIIVYGHDARTGLVDRPFAIGLDTGCCYGGKLTAVILPERRLVSVPAHAVHSAPTAKIPCS